MPNGYRASIGALSSADLYASQQENEPASGTLQDKHGLPLSTDVLDSHAKGKASTAQFGDDASQLYNPLFSADDMLESAYNSRANTPTSFQRQTKPYTDNAERRGRTETRSIHRKSLLDPTAFGFDVQNIDPREVMGGQDPDVVRPTSRVWNSVASSSRSTPQAGSQVEMVTIPGLGAEYSEEEVQGMRKANRRTLEQWGRFRRGWTQIPAVPVQNDKDNHPVRSRRCCRFDPRMVVMVTFGVLTALALLLYFVVPRVPSFAVQTTRPLVAIPDASGMVTHRVPTNFSMLMQINLRADNGANWVPTRVNRLEMDVLDLDTYKTVGQGSLEGISLPAQHSTTFSMPVHFAYASLNATGDQTWAHWINACGPQYANTPRQTLNLHFALRIDILGLVGTRGTSVQLSGLQCPFTLQADQT